MTLYSDITGPPDRATVIADASVTSTTVDLPFGGPGELMVTAILGGFGSTLAAPVSWAIAAFVPGDFPVAAVWVRQREAAEPDPTFTRSPAGPMLGALFDFATNTDGADVATGFGIGTSIAFTEYPQGPTAWAPGYAYVLVVTAGSGPPLDIEGSMVATGAVAQLAVAQLGGISVERMHVYGFRGDGVTPGDELQVVTNGEPENQITGWAFLRFAYARPVWRIGSV